MKNNNTRICLISDTHGQHNKLNNLPDADIIIHAGDSTSIGTEGQMREFLGWFSSLEQYSHRVLIGGNHDFFLDFEHKKSTGTQKKLDEMMPDNVVYLNDSGITINDINIWGSPVQPWFYDWGFNRRRGDEILKHWNLIDDDCDILVTHGPPSDVDFLDRCVDGRKVGCADLYRKIIEIKPSLVVFGHIHEGYGHITKEIMSEDGESVEKVVTFVNASVLNHRYEMVNKPIIIELSKDKEVKKIIK